MTIPISNFGIREPKMFSKPIVSFSYPLFEPGIHEIEEYFKCWKNCMFLFPLMIFCLFSLCHTFLHCTYTICKCYWLICASSIDVVINLSPIICEVIIVSDNEAQSVNIPHAWVWVIFLVYLRLTFIRYKL